MLYVRPRRLWHRPLTPQGSSLDTRRNCVSTGVIEAATPLCPSVCFVESGPLPAPASDPDVVRHGGASGPSLRLPADTAADDPAYRDEQTLTIHLLGGFRVEREGRPVPESARPRPGAKTLVKLLAVEPGHSLHREQIQQCLWPEADPDAAHGRFRQMLHAARQALEPERVRGAGSSYLKLAAGVLSLNVERVWIDVDAFTAEAERALARDDEQLLGGVVARYRGPMLPEDRYEDWAIERREALADLHLRCLLALATILEGRRRYQAAAERLQRVLVEDPTREDVHRRLMRLYVAAGSRHQALRQYQLCRKAVHEHLDMGPEPETEALHADIVAGTATRGIAASRASDDVSTGMPPLPTVIRQSPVSPFVGRKRSRRLLLGGLGLAPEEGAAFTRVGEPASLGPRGWDIDTRRSWTDVTDTPVVLIGGEAGIGKSRLVAEVAREAHRHGIVVLWGASYEHEGQRAYGPFVEAINGYLAGQAPTERAALGGAYPELRPILPHLVADDVPVPAPDPASDQARLHSGVLRLLADIAGRHAGRHAGQADPARPGRSPRRRYCHAAAPPLCGASRNVGRFAGPMWRSVAAAAHGHLSRRGRGSGQRAGPAPGDDDAHRPRSEGRSAAAGSF